MKTHATKNADSPPSTDLKGTRPFSSQSSPAPASEETDLEAWQERASRFGHYFDGPAIQAKGEAAASGSEPVIQRNGDELKKLKKLVAEGQDLSGSPQSAIAIAEHRSDGGVAASSSDDASKMIAQSDKLIAQASLQAQQADKYKKRTSYK